MTIGLERPVAASRGGRVFVPADGNPGTGLAGPGFHDFPALPMQQQDAVVIGGGPAGLAAAMYLARFRRDVLVIDDQQSRAARIPRSHNLAGHPAGIPGHELLARMRQQVTALGVRIVHGRVAQLERRHEGFEVRWTGGQAVAGTVLLATGATDNEPAMASTAEAIDVGALRYCPVCDGYEIIDQSVGVLCNSTAGLREALYLRDFTNRLQVFLTSREVLIPAEIRGQLEALGIAIHADPAQRIRLDGDKVVVHHADQATRLDSLYSALGMRVHSDLATALGAERDGEGYLLTDRHQQTTVAGLYTAGDVAKGLNQISVAIGDGAVAASAMHLRLSARDKAR